MAHLRISLAVKQAISQLVAQEAFLGSKVDWAANCFHKSSSSLPMCGGTWMEIAT
jgi:hypothetical protein